MKKSAETESELPFFGRFKQHYKEQKSHNFPLILGLVLIAGFFVSASLSPTISRNLGNLSQKKQQQAAHAQLEERSQLVVLINQYRQQNGKSVLQEDQMLTNAACWMSRYLADNDTAENQIYGTHYDNLGRDPTQRAIDFGMYSGDSAGENIDASKFTADEVFNSWKNSPGHDAIMLFDNPPTIDITRFGIGVAYNANSRYKIYWTMDIATSRSNQFNQLTTVSSDCSFSPPAPPVNNPPVGTTDELINSTCRVRGWAYDPDTPGANVAIHVYRDGLAGSGAAGKSSYIANTSRPDVNSAYGISGNHGFDITFDPSGDSFDRGFFDGATHTVYVYAIDTAGGTNPLLGMTNNISRNITCNPPPAQPLPSKGNVNCDDTVNSVDALLVLRYVAELTTLSDTCQAGKVYKPQADVDSNGIINAVDALQILRYVAGLPSPLNNNVSSAQAMADSDLDGFANGIENYIGTNPNLKCGVNAWPPDINNDGKVTLTDPLSFNPVFNTKIGDSKYNKRFDLDANGTIALSDVLKLNAYFNTTCR